MHLRFEKFPFAAVYGLPELSEDMKLKVSSELKKNVPGIAAAVFLGDTLLIQPDVHLLFEDTVAKVFDQIQQLFPEETVLGDRRAAVRALDTCWPVRVGS